MKYAIYEDPITHRFAHLPLPGRFSDGDRLPPIAIDRWFESHQAAVDALSELFAYDDAESAPTEDAAAQMSAVPQQIVTATRPFFWFQH
jgi:hypothetical protein